MCIYMAVVEKGKLCGIVEEGPEYENVVMLGSN